jgi:hypothetical protein
MRRRDLLRALLLLLVDAPASVAAEPGPAGLSDAERTTLLAFAEVLVGGRPFSPPERGEILNHLDDRIKASEPMLILYREAAASLDQRAGARFSALGIRSRTELVARDHLAPSPGQLHPPDDDAYRVRTRVAPDLIAAYYRSSVGWAIVGYTVFPGRCGDLTRYTHPEA